MKRTVGNISWLLRSRRTRHLDGRPLFEAANNLVYVLFRDVLDFLLVVNRKQVDTSVGRLNNHIQGYHTKAATFTTSFAFDAKTDFVFSTAKGNTRFRILHQLKLQCVNIIRKTMVTLGQALGLTQEFLGIVESHHKSLCFSPKLIDQGVKGIKVLASETSLLGFLITTCYGFFDKSFFGFNIRFGSNQFVNGHTLYGTQDLFQAGHEAGIFNVQNNLCHNYKVLFILPAKINRISETARGRVNIGNWRNGTLSSLKRELYS